MLGLAGATAGCHQGAVPLAVERAPSARSQRPASMGRFLEIANFRLSDGGLPKGGTTAGALQHSYCGHYEWILVARVVWVVCYVVWEEQVWPRHVFDIPSSSDHPHTPPARGRHMLQPRGLSCSRTASGASFRWRCGGRLQTLPEEAEGSTEGRCCLRAAPGMPLPSAMPSTRFFRCAAPG